MEKKDLVSYLSFVVLIGSMIGTSIYNYSTVNSKVESITVEMNKRVKNVEKQAEIDTKLQLLEDRVSSHYKIIAQNDTRITNISNKQSDMQQQAATIAVIVKSLDKTLGKVNSTLDKLNNTVIIVNGDLKRLKKDMEDIKENNNDRK